MEFYDLDDFLKISALLNYQLSAKQPKLEQHHSHRIGGETDSAP